MSNNYAEQMAQYIAMYTDYKTPMYELGNSKPYYVYNRSTTNPPATNVYAPYPDYNMEEARIRLEEKRHAEQIRQSLIWSSAQIYAKQQNLKTFVPELSMILNCLGDIASHISGALVDKWKMMFVADFNNDVTNNTHQIPVTMTVPIPAYIVLTRTLKDRELAWLAGAVYVDQRYEFKWEHGMLVDETKQVGRKIQF